MSSQVRAFLPVLDVLERRRTTLPDWTLELQIETPQAVVGPDGTMTHARGWCMRPAPA